MGKASSTRQTGVAEQSPKIADLFSKCSQLADQEEREMQRIVNTMLPLLAYVNEPVILHPASLGPSFSGLKSAWLQAGAVVVMTDFLGASKKPLAKFNTAECLGIIKDAYPELQRLVAERKRSDLVRPLLSVKVVLGGQRFVLDMRSYRLIVSNSGGDCRNLRVSAVLPGGRSKPYRERDLSRGGRAEVDLGVFKEVEGKETLRLVFECKDVDGRELCGDESLPLDGLSLLEVPLQRKA